MCIKASKQDRQADMASKGRVSPGAEIGDAQARFPLFIFS